MDAAGEMLGNIQFAFHKGPLDDQLRSLVLEASPFPLLDLLPHRPHRVEVPLHAIHADRKDVHDARVLRVLGEYGRENTPNY